LTLTVTRHHSSAVELCRDIARDLHISVGDIDQVCYITEALLLLLLLLLIMMIVVVVSDGEQLVDVAAALYFRSIFL